MKFSRKITPEESSLIEAHLWCARYVVDSFAFRQYKLRDEDECMGLAYEGLCRAAMAYDDSTGCKFSTFAIACIKHFLRRYLYYQKLRKKNMPPGGVVVSLNTTMYKESESGMEPLELVETIADRAPYSDPCDRVVQQIADENILRHWAAEAPMLYMKYSKGLTFGEMGAQLGLTAGGASYRVQQERKRIIRDRRYREWANA